MIVKVHHKGTTSIVAVCDSKLHGQKISQDELEIDLSSPYYCGEEKDEQEAGDLLRNADVINVVGKKSVALALKEGLIDKENIVTIDEVPFAQAVIIRD